MTEVRFEMQPRNATIGQLVHDCATGKLAFDALCEQVAAMGYKTTSLYEMVRAVECAAAKSE
jgi:hypothetical protein